MKAVTDITQKTGEVAFFLEVVYTEEK